MHGDNPRNAPGAICAALAQVMSAAAGLLRKVSCCFSGCHTGVGCRPDLPRSRQSRAMLIAARSSSPIGRRTCL